MPELIALDCTRVNTYQYVTSTILIKDAIEGANLASLVAIDYVIQYFIMVTILDPWIVLVKFI